MMIWLMLYIAGIMFSLMLDQTFPGMFCIFEGKWGAVVGAIIWPLLFSLLVILAIAIVIFWAGECAIRWLVAKFSKK